MIKEGHLTSSSEAGGAVTMVEGLDLPIRQTGFWKNWPIVLMAPIAVFLGLQFLRMLFPRAKAS